MVQPEQAAAPTSASLQLDPLRLQLALPEQFEDFYRKHYRDLYATARIAGATKQEAEDAASKTLEEMLPKWPIPGYPLMYARRAVINNFVRERFAG